MWALQNDFDFTNPYLNLLFFKDSDTRILDLLLLCALYYLLQVKLEKVVSDLHWNIF